MCFQNTSIVFTHLLIIGIWVLKLQVDTCAEERIVAAVLELVELAGNLTSLTGVGI